MKKIAIIMGSINDWKHISNIEVIFNTFEYEFEKFVVSAHRTPEYMYEFSKDAHKNFDVIIAAAGGSAHLPGMVASLTTLPVIGIPIKTEIFDGVDSLLSIIQMPKGTPVATVGVNAAENAGLLALRIVALNNKELEQKLLNYKQDVKSKIITNSKF